MLTVCCRAAIEKYSKLYLIRRSSFLTALLNERDMLLDVLMLPIYHSHLYSKLKERLIYTVSRFFIYQKNRIQITLLTQVFPVALKLIDLRYNFECNGLI